MGNGTIIHERIDECRFRQRLEQENEDAMDENMLPFGIINRGESAANAPIAAKRGDDSWLTAGDNDYDNLMLEKNGSYGWK